MAPTAMPEPARMEIERNPTYERRLRTVKACVLTLACLVVLSLMVAVVFGVYNYATDRPAKELFFAPDK